jgi:hypothetical protein
VLDLRVVWSPQVIVGTHGRLKNWVAKRQLDVDRICILVFDEADEMLKADAFADDSGDNTVPEALRFRLEFVVACCSVYCQPALVPRVSAALWLQVCNMCLCEAAARCVAFASWC